MEFEQHQEVKFWRNWAKKHIEQQKTGINKETAQLHSNLINALLDIPEIRNELMQVLAQEIKEQRDLEFDKNENHWKFVRNNNGEVGDFRLVHFNQGTITEEAYILAREGANRFAYWNKNYSNITGGVRIFRGPNLPAAKKIQEMIDGLK